jgi:glucose/arabinose dehydrogenase
VRLVRAASFDQPLAMAFRRGDPALYVAEKTGRVWALSGGTRGPAPVLDLSAQVSNGGEQGLLGLAFSPDGRFLYVNYTDVAGDTHVAEYAWRDGRADPASRREVLFVTQPYSNHNGGNLVFGPDGDLYIGLGDGGSAGDPMGNGQKLSTLLGKMLRIDPRPSGGAAYSIPPDNPFVGRAGARSEIWAFGLRNPWRYSFDRTTGDMWIGDVGQSQWEEVDFQRGAGGGGQNYGWNRMEGNHPYSGSPPPGVVPPVDEFDHSSGECAITGGYVYRGTAIPGLRGAYLFGDFCKGDIMALRLDRGRVVQSRALGVNVPQLASFGEDQAGELYAMSLQGTVFRLAP